MIKLFLQATSTSLELDAIGFGVVAITPVSKTLHLKDDPKASKAKDYIFSFWGGERKQANTTKIALNALTDALKEMTKEYLINCTDKEIRIYTNYQVIVRGGNRFADYKDMMKSIAGRDKKALHNDWKRFYGVKSALLDMGFKFTLFEPTTHRDVNTYEPYCDALAGRGITNLWLSSENKVFDSMTATDLSLNDKPKGRISPLLRDKYMYFRCGEGDERTQGRNVYYIGCGEFYKNAKLAAQVKSAPTTMYVGHLADVRYLGRPSANTRSSVAILNKEDEYVKQLRDLQDTFVTKMYGYDHLTVIDLSVAVKPRVRSLIEKHGTDVVAVSMRGAMLNTNLERLEMSHVFHPPRNAFLLNKQFDRNESALRSIMDRKSDWKLTDVHGLLLGFKTLTLTKHDKAVKVKVKAEINGKEVEAKIRLLVGKDTPEFTYLSQIHKGLLSCNIATKQLNNHAFEFALVMEHKDGWLFWQCPHGSVHWLPSISKRAKKK